MSVPPPPGQYGAPPPSAGGPWGPPPQGWQTGPPPKRSKAKWIVLGGIALVAVIAITVVITMSVTNKGSGESSGPTTSGTEVASANDTGPVTIITEEPTCEKWVDIANQLSANTKNGWGQRDPKASAKDWTREQRQQFDDVGVAMKLAADRAVPLVAVTPHRLTRELFEIFILHARLYAQSINDYEARDESVARIVVNSSTALSSLCSSISFGSAQAAASLSSSAGPSPGRLSAAKDLRTFEPIFSQSNTTCEKLTPAVEILDRDTADWRLLDSNIPASQFTAAQRTVQDSAVTKFRDFASTAKLLSAEAETPLVNDLLNMAAIYIDAYADASTNYTPADSYLISAGSSAATILNQGCAFAGG